MTSHARTPCSIVKQLGMSIDRGLCARTYTTPCNQTHELGGDRSRREVELWKKRVMTKKRPQPGIEPGTSCTRSRNHTSRPLGHNRSPQRFLNSKSELMKKDYLCSVLLPAFGKSSFSTLLPAFFSIGWSTKEMILIGHKYHFQQRTYETPADEMMLMQFC